LERQVISIGTLTKYIKQRIESDCLMQDIWVQGEISNFTHHSSGHMYFTLKDKESKVKCIMFARANQRLVFAPKEGAKVLARGSVSVYERDGNVQFYITEMQPDGVGSLYLAFEQLKKKLETEGLFSPERKRAIPVFPRGVGVITSPTGAAVRDIFTTLHRRFPSIPVLLIPAQVQGDLAAPSIVKAIERMNTLPDIDTIIVGRGGGSLEELWAFNEEQVVRAIASSRIPIISAVGHETDFTISDFVADLRAPTPTAAAELAVPNRSDLIEQFKHLQSRMKQALKKDVQVNRQRLERVLTSSVLTQPIKLLHTPMQKLDRLHEQLHVRMEKLFTRSSDRLIQVRNRFEQSNPKHKVARANDRHASFALRLQQAIARQTILKQNQFTMLVRQLDALSPLKVMSRGYSLTYDEHEKTLMKSVNQVNMGDLIKVRLHDGTLSCQVWAMKEEEIHD
jgi:exodeoxyribonuclease VII large subunit